MEIGRVGIITEMSSQTAMPREGHLEAVLHMFVFLCQRYNSRMAFELTYHNINMSDFKEWK